MENFNDLSYKKQCLIAEQLRTLNNNKFLELVNKCEDYEKFNILNLENLWNELHNDYDKKRINRIIFKK